MGWTAQVEESLDLLTWYSRQGRTHRRTMPPVEFWDYLGRMPVMESTRSL